MRQKQQTVLVAFASAVALELLLLAAWSLQSREQSARADHDTVSTGFSGDDVAIDMVIDDNGDTTPDNGANTLGPIDACLEVTSGNSFQFDVVLDRIPLGQNLGGFNYEISPGLASSLPAELVVTARDSFTNGVNILTNQGKGVTLDLGTAPPAALNGFQLATTDLGTAESQPTTTRGVMTRFAVSTTGFSMGAYTISLAGGSVTLELFTGAGSSYAPDNVIDADEGFGVISVDQLCPVDTDGDGIFDASDNCPNDPNPGQENVVHPLTPAGDACEDPDTDGVVDATDNSPDTANPGQADQDGDNIGDACDPDIDGDGVLNGVDNCPTVANPGQADQDGDNIRDARDPHIDGDGVLNGADNCPTDA